jgi:ATP-binding cassette, subfamily B, bacterial PglK
MNYFFKVYSILKRNQNQINRLAILICLMLISTLLEMFSIAMVLPLIIFLIDPVNALKELSGSNVKLFEFLEYFEIETDLIFVLIVFIIAYFFKALFLSFQSWFHIKFIHSIQKNLSELIFGNYLHKPYTFHILKNSSELIKNITTEVNLFTSSIMSITSFFIEILVLIGLTLLLFFIEPYGMLILVGVFSVMFALFTLVMKKKILNWGEVRLFNEGMRLKQIIQGLNGYKEYLLLGKTSSVLDDFSIYNSKFINVVRRQNLFDALPRYWLEFVAVSSLIIIVMLLTSKGENSSVIPIVGVFAAVALRILPSVSKIVSFWQAISFSTPTINLIFEITRGMDKNIHSIKEAGYSDKQKSGIFKLHNNTWSSIHIDNVSYFYPNSTCAINKIDFHIYNGSVIGLIGESGSGKSTLSNLITGLLTPSKGCIEVDNISVHSILDEWRESIGYVSQNSILIDDSIEMNIALGVQKNLINKTLMKKVIAQVKLDSFISSLHDGIDTIIGEDGVRLSGGQRQRVAIARALYHEPSILIFDESTSALDNETESAIVDEIKLMKGEMTIIIIAHRLTTLRYCDVVYKISKGAVIKHGTYKEMIE